MNVKMENRSFFSSVLLSLLLVLASAGAVRAQDKINLSRLVVVGDSLAAGVENGSLEYSQQEHGFAAVVARQAATPLVLPLVPYPGAPNKLELVSAGFPPVIQPVPGTLFFPRFNPFAIITDVAVPLQTVGDALNRKPTANLQTTDETQLATDVVLGFPCPILFPCPALTQVEYAVALRPTTLIVDLGNNDILGAVTSGQLGTLLASPSTFLANFNASYSTLLNDLAATRATLVVANIPDIMEAPYFIPAAKLAAAAGVPLPELTAALGIGDQDYVTLNALPAIEAILSGATQGPLAEFCDSTTLTTPCLVPQADAVALRIITIGMNGLIGVQASAHHAALVDLFTLVNNLSANGYTVGSTTLTTDFLGGLFSLDGLHPTNTGYGIMANQFIQAMNAAFHTHIPLANIPEIAERDPLVFP